MVNMAFSMQFSFVIFLFLSYQFVFSHLCSKHDVVSLLNFKNSFTLDPEVYCFTLKNDVGQKSKPKTSSWNMSRDCCSWDGVICHEMTGHVVELDLSCSQLVGVIDSNSSLFQLSQLQRLDLSYNNFSNSHISPEFGRFTSLTHLDLSESSFSGQIPSEISRLSKLQSLFFSSSSLRFEPHDFKLLLRNLTQLRELDLSGVNISSTIPLNFSSHLTTLRLELSGLYGIIPESIFHLPNLKTLILWENDQLSGYLPKTKWNSSASLMKLDLTNVNFSGNLPESLGYLTSLHYLSLQNCSLRGPIPESLPNLIHLENLDLGWNSLNGTIPSGMFSLPSLIHLDLSNNYFSGNLPESLSDLIRLEYLELGWNSLNGTIPSWLFSLQSLSLIDLRQNHFSGQLEDFKSNSLQVILLGGNQLQGHLPNSIQNFVNLTVLDLSFNNFSGNVDVNLFSDLKYLDHLDLSYNRISLTNENKVKSTLPQSLDDLRLAACEVKDMEFLRSAKQLWWLDLSNNKIEGRIPDWAWSNWMTSLTSLNISHNMLTTVDSIPLQAVYIYLIDLRSNLLQGSLPIPPDSTRYFFISQNNLSGQIHESICNLTSLVMLDLAKNNLKGVIPQCLGNISSLEVLDMHHNSLTGTLPMTFGTGSSLRSLNLHGNKLEGKIPRSLGNCTKLEVVDLGDNQLNDTFPMWLGTLPNLQVLSLRSNKLHGSIQPSRTGSMFPDLRIIDLSCNAFSGNLPTSLFQHLKAMRTIDPSKQAWTIDPSKQAPSEKYYQDSVAVVTKGFEREIVRILFLYTAIDLSNNKFEGPIPSVLGELTALRVLNLSHDGFQGNIPSSLGSLSSVESLDLSGNHLVGEIPTEFASLTSLEVLNLSYNHLEGCIPQGNQFHTFENNSYEGNHGLRGFPVSKGCGNDPVSDTNHTVSALDDEESDSEFLRDFWKAALMGYGSGLCIGFSIIYFMFSSGRPIWLARIIVQLEHKIMMGRTKKQQRQRNQRRRNNRF